jgi:hypothetical protein
MRCEYRVEQDPKGVFGGGQSRDSVLAISNRKRAVSSGFNMHESLTFVQQSRRRLCQLPIFSCKTLISPFPTSFPPHAVEAQTNHEEAVWWKRVREKEDSIIRSDPISSHPLILTSLSPEPQPPPPPPYRPVSPSDQQAGSQLLNRIKARVQETEIPNPSNSLT